ncbi:MAG: 1-deoxy-D-xylulose-5-phosphate synthase, partial [Candidatus Omnitrophica bacterium]|nr:1-deoxy-D-xylulose-5-phosphate synthase [Candidatus Omnitrophota bacterium]
MASLLESIKSPRDIKKLDMENLERLADEIRVRMIGVTSKKGGHLASSLGAVEIVIALHYCLNTPEDRIIWDVGHQSYAHKILTGRNEAFDTLREMGGISGFPNAKESPYDTFTSGHSSTSISSALGLAKARDLKGLKYKVAAVIGDASLSTGLAFEGLNHAGHDKTGMLIVLNDNDHSIARPVGALSGYLNKVISNPLYNKVREESEKLVNRIPRVGASAVNTARKFQEGLKNLIVPGILFEELGVRYFGPIDGHDLESLISMIPRIADLKEPVLLHTVTRKGKGYDFAEKEPIRFHGILSFDPETGEQKKKKERTFTDHFSDIMMDLAEKHPELVAVTAAMPDGTGLARMAERMPERVFDVGITEGHAVTFAGGLARGGMKPVVAIYSTFMQRAYDQLIHDVALQELPVVFCLDRAGLVGRDGPTHHGVFDIAYTRTLPGFVVMAPKDGTELEHMMEKAVKWDRPVVIRYPRSVCRQIVPEVSCQPVEIAKAEELRKGRRTAIIAVGEMVNTALLAADRLSHKGIETGVVNARFIKPLDKQMLEDMFRRYECIYTLEEGVVTGGFGSGVLEFAEM